MIKNFLWASLMVCAALLPFFTSDVSRAETHILYALSAVVLLVLALSEKSCLRNLNIIMPLGLWFLVVVLTSVYAVYKHAALEGAGNFLFCALFFVVIAGFDKTRKRDIAFILAIMSLFISIRAISQYFLFFDRLLPFSADQNFILTIKELLYIADIVQRQRPVSVFVNPNLLASYLAMINLFVISFCFTSKGRLSRLFFLLLLIINIYALWLTRSITGLSSFVFGVIIFSVLFSLNTEKSDECFNRRLFILGAGLSVLFIVLFVKRILYDSGTDNLLLSLAGRLEFWKTSITIIADRPLRFAGLGGFGHLYRMYAPFARLESVMAHNIIMQLWIETGLYGLLAFIWFVLSVIYYGVKNLLVNRSCFERYVFKAGILSAILAFLLHNMFDFSFFITQVSIIWWFLCGILIDDR